MLEEGVELGGDVESVVFELGFEVAIGASEGVDQGEVGVEASELPGAEGDPSGEQVGEGVSGGEGLEALEVDAGEVEGVGEEVAADRGGDGGGGAVGGAVVGEEGAAGVVGEVASVEAVGALGASEGVAEPEA